MRRRIVNFIICIGLWSKCRSRASLSWERFLSLSYYDGQNLQWIFQSISSLVYIDCWHVFPDFTIPGKEERYCTSRSMTSDGARKYILTTKFDTKDKKPLFPSLRGHRWCIVERYGNIRIRYNPESPTPLSVLVETLQVRARNRSQPTTKARYWMIMDTVLGRGLKQHIIVRHLYSMTRNEVWGFSEIATTRISGVLENGGRIRGMCHWPAYCRWAPHETRCVRNALDIPPPG